MLKNEAGRFGQARESVHAFQDGGSWTWTACRAWDCALIGPCRGAVADRSDEIVTPYALVCSGAAGRSKNMPAVEGESWTAKL